MRVPHHCSNRRTSLLLERERAQYKPFHHRRTHTSTPSRHDGVESVWPKVHVRALCVSPTAHTAAHQ
jgi:hypothetical protein